MCESSEEELRQLATRYQDQLKEVQELQDKLQVAIASMIQMTIIEYNLK